MSCFLQHPRLPESRGKVVLVSGEYPRLKEALNDLGLVVISTAADRRLPGPVQFHPDLQVCPFPNKQMFVLKNSFLAPLLARSGFSVRETVRAPGNTYPKDVLCGGLVWNSYLVGNPRGVDPAIQEAAQKQGAKVTAPVQWP